MIAVASALSVDECVIARKSRASVETIKLAVDMTCMCSILKFTAQKLSPPNLHLALVIAMPLSRVVNKKPAARAVIKKPAAAKQRTEAKHAGTLQFEAGYLINMHSSVVQVD